MKKSHNYNTSKMMVCNICNKCNKCNKC